MNDLKKISCEPISVATDQDALISEWAPCILWFPDSEKEIYAFFVTAKKRNEEAYIIGVSTSKIERLTKEMGIEGISASQVSSINKGLDKQVEEFGNCEHLRIVSSISLDISLFYLYNLSYLQYNIYISIR